MMLASPRGSCRNLEKIKFAPSPTDARSRIAFPTHSEAYQLRVTGLYVPPSAEATPDVLDSFSSPPFQSGGP